MPDYIQITADFPELMAAAAKLSADVNQYSADVAGHVGAISSMDSDAQMGMDELGKVFLHTTYNLPVAGDNGSMPASQAAKQGATAVGTTAGYFADGIGTAMQGYAMAEMENDAAMSVLKKEADANKHGK